MSVRFSASSSPQAAVLKEDRKTPKSIRKKKKDRPLSTEYAKGVISDSDLSEGSVGTPRGLAKEKEMWMSKLMKENPELLEFKERIRPITSQPTFGRNFGAIREYQRNFAGI
mgnify:CR=1 FL=1